MSSSVRFEPGKHEATVSMVCFRGKQLSSWLIKSTCKFHMLVRRSFMVLTGSVCMSYNLMRNSDDLFLCNSVQVSLASSR